MNPDSRKAMALAEAKRLFQAGETQCWARRDRMIEWLMAWHGQVTGSHSAQRSQVGHDVTRESIERILPKLLGTNIAFNYYKQGKFQQAPTVLAEHYMAGMHYFIQKLQQNRDKCIYGRGVGKWRYVVDRRLRRRRLRPRETAAFLAMGIEAQALKGRFEEPVVAWDGPKFHAVDPFALTYDTSVGGTPYSMGYMFEECQKTARHMAIEIEEGRMDKAATHAYMKWDNKPLGSTARWRSQIATRIGIDLGAVPMPDALTHWTTYEGYFPFDLYGTLKEYPCIVETDPGFMFPLRVEENPFDHGLPPYSFEDWIRVTGEFWPIGIAEMLEPVQTMVNVWANMAIDNIILSVFAIWLKHAEAGIPWNTMRVIPNQIIQTQITDGLQALRPPDHTAQIHSWLQFYLKRAQEQSGITAFSALGTPELGQTKTALGIQTLKASAEEFLAFAKRIMIEEGMDYDARFLLELMQQFVDTDKDIAIRGQDGLMMPFIVTPEDLDGDFEWRINVEQKNPLSRTLDSQAFEAWVAKVLKMGMPLNIPMVAAKMAMMTDVSELAHPEQFFMQQPGMPGLGGGAPGTPQMLMQAMQAAQSGGLDSDGTQSFEGGPQPAGGALSMMAGAQ
jgi:hypothetical protein